VPVNSQAGFRRACDLLVTRSLSSNHVKPEAGHELAPQSGAI